MKNHLVCALFTLLITGCGGWERPAPGDANFSNTPHPSDYLNIPKLPAGVEMETEIKPLPKTTPPPISKPQCTLIKQHDLGNVGWSRVASNLITTMVVYEDMTKHCWKGVLFSHDGSKVQKGLDCLTGTLGTKTNEGWIFYIQSAELNYIYSAWDGVKTGLVRLSDNLTTIHSAIGNSQVANLNYAGEVISGTRSSKCSVDGAPTSAYSVDKVKIDAKLLNLMCLEIPGLLSSSVEGMDSIGKVYALGVNQYSKTYNQQELKLILMDQSSMTGMPILISSWKMDYSMYAPMYINSVHAVGGNFYVHYTRDGGPTGSGPNLGSFIAVVNKGGLVIKTVKLKDSNSDNLKPLPLGGWVYTSYRHNDLAAGLVFLDKNIQETSFLKFSLNKADLKGSMGASDLSVSPKGKYLTVTARYSGKPAKNSVLFYECQ